MMKIRFPLHHIGIEDPFVEIPGFHNDEDRTEVSSLTVTQTLAILFNWFPGISKEAFNRLFYIRTFCQ